MTTAKEIVKLFEDLRNDEQRKVLMRFFKTAPGQYGEGDEFLGIKVPQTREIVRLAKLQLPFDEIEKLLYCKYHEVRLCGFLLLVEEMKSTLRHTGRSLNTRGEASRTHTQPADNKYNIRDEIAGFYLRNAKQANNWDLVDLSAPGVIGEWLLNSDTDGRVLDDLSASESLWEQRIAIVSTFTLIKALQFDDTLRIAEGLLCHPHDLIHKAVGWMLREVGKRDTGTLRAFLKAHYQSLHRTTLRYAIEKMSASERLYWMNYR